jgi:hypothetical protein
MIPSDNFFIGGGPASTTATPIATCLLALTIVSMLLIPRKHLLLPLLLGAFLLPTGNHFVVLGVHLMPVRVLVLFGWLRLALSGVRPAQDRLAGGFNAIDRAFLGYSVVTAVAVTLQWMNVSAIANQCGFVWNTLGMYFLLRQLIRRDDDTARTIKVLIAVAAVNVVSMLTEQFRLENLFGTFIGGVQASPLIRLSKVRSQGAFQHAITAGVFGATTLPLCLWLWRVRRSRALALLGILVTSAMTLTSSSSTPLVAYVAGLLPVFLWPFRRYMRLLRLGIALALVGLHIVMNAPVWFLIARVDVAGGSASYDRANLIDTCIRHFWDWWLYGTHDTGNWGWSMWDLSNQFVSIAETGGLVALLCFVGVVSRSFGSLGRTRAAVQLHRENEWGTWLLGCALFAHIVAFFGVSAFDQSQVAWFVLLSIIAASTIPQTFVVSEDTLCVKLNKHTASDTAGVPEFVR